MAETTGEINTYHKSIDSIPGRGDLQTVGLLEEWRKLLLRPVNVSASGHIISGVLTHVRSDHIIVVGESYVHIISSQSVTFICYRFRAEK